MSCGTGSRTKERSIVEQAVNGGKACEGNSIETGVCNLEDCVGMYMLPRFKVVTDKFWGVSIQG